MTRVDQMFEQVEAESFDNKAKLTQCIRKICSDNIAYIYVAKGTCQLRPVVNVSDGCVVCIKIITPSGDVVYRKFEYEGVQYERLCFGKDS